MFAAYLDNNLDEHGMNEIDTATANNPVIEDLMSTSDVVDEYIVHYKNDKFAYEADLEALENSVIEIPSFDEGANDFTNESYDNFEKRECAATAASPNENNYVFRIEDSIDDTNTEIIEDNVIPEINTINPHNNIEEVDFTDPLNHTIDENIFSM